MWYTTGTVNVTKNSKVVTGVGTQWTNTLAGVSAGRMLLLQTSTAAEIYEIASIQSDTQLTLVENYAGTTGTGKTYKIPTSTPVSIEQLANEISNTLGYYQKQMDGWNQILTGTGDVVLVSPNGQQVTIKSQKGLADAVSAAVKKGEALPCATTALNDTSNLNDFTGSKYGAYYCVGGSLDNNYPEPDAGSLLVLRVNGEYCTQQFTSFRSQKTYTRSNISSKNWSPWVVLITANGGDVANLSVAGKKALVAGDGGIGTGASQINLSDIDIDTTNFNVGFYSGINWSSSKTELPFGNANSWFYLINQNLASQGDLYKLQIIADLYRNIAFRCKVNGNFSSWVKFYTTNNTTKDTNGNIKAASPILQLYSTDEIDDKDGFTKAGYGLANSEALGVTAKRIGVGHYEVHNSLGFAKEGWYITLPEDANGNKKIFAEYSTDENNVITIKTYTKKFDFEKCEVVAGEPIDITDGRWIDVRLEMPVVETVEQIEPIPSVLNAVVTE